MNNAGSYCSLLKITLQTESNLFMLLLRLNVFRLLLLAIVYISNKEMPRIDAWILPGRDRFLHERKLTSCFGRQKNSTVFMKICLPLWETKDAPRIVGVTVYHQDFFMLWNPVGMVKLNWQRTVHLVPCYLRMVGCFHILYFSGEAWLIIHSYGIATRSPVYELTARCYG